MPITDSNAIVSLGDFSLKMASGSRGDMDRRRWSDLPADALREISDRVCDAADFVSFHAVCKQWRGSRDPLSRARTTRTQFPPWLLTPPDKEPGHLKFRCVFSKASYCMVAPSPVPRRNWVCSADGAGVWYLSVDEGLRPSLHDPLTGAVAHLPTFPWEWEEEEEEFNPCGVIYDDGTTFLYSIDQVVGGGNESGWFRAALLRPGDAEWTAVERTVRAPSVLHGEFCATYHLGKIMVTVEASLWHVVTPDGGDDVVVPRPPRLRREEEEPYLRQYSHVLESCGELLWVVVQVQLYRYTSMTGTSWARRMLSVVVHALGEETTSPEKKKTRWVRKDGRSLTDRVMFLGWPNSFAMAMDASRLGGRDDGGCVYFVYNESKALHREEVGVFRYNLLDDKVHYWYYGRQNNLEFIERLPQGLDGERCTWLVPQPAIAPIQELNERALKAQEQQQQTTIVTRPTHIAHTERHYKPSFRVLVRNLPLTVKNSQLQLFFSNHGKVSNAEVIYYKKTKRSQGIGFVTLSTTHANQEDALDALNTLFLDGCRLEVSLLGRRRRRPCSTKVV